MYRKDPSVIVSSWYDRIIALLDDPNLGVATSVASLVIALVQDDPDQCKMSYGKVVRRLHSLVFNQDYSPDYIYYDVPCPWLFIKLLRILQYYSPSDDETISSAIHKVILKIIENNSVPANNLQQNNAQNAVLFEVISLAIHLDVDAALLQRIVQALGQFLTSPETNVRYLSLNSMANIAARYENVPVKGYLLTILQALKDRDISVRRKAIDVLYSVCDSSNVKSIVNELLKYLQAADFAIREEMVVRIAILIEKYATEFQWYVDISLRLIAVAGDHVSDEVWQRVIQIVVNNENLQAYAGRTVFNYLKQPHFHENMIKVGGYILGEYGHLIADEPGNSPIEQFLALHDKFSNCTPYTKCLLLNTYIKFVNLFVEIKPQLVQVFEFYSTSIDSEIQQRACEYLRLANHANPELLRTVCDEMPPFPERTSALLTRLHSKHAQSEDKRVWVLGNKQSQEEATALHLDKKQFETHGEKPGGVLSRSNTTKSLQSVSSSDSTSKPSPPLPRKSATFPVPSTTKSEKDLLSSGWEQGYKKLLYSREGIFYEDSLIQIGLKSEYRRHLGCVILYFKNISESVLQSLSAELSNPAGDDVLVVSTKNMPDSTISIGGLTQQVIIIDAKGPFLQSPIVKITYLAGTLKILNLKLPIVLEKFMEPAALSASDFFIRWKQLGEDSTRESQKIFKNISNSSTMADTKEVNDRRKVEGLNWYLIDDLDRKPKELSWKFNNTDIRRWEFWLSVAP